jgi:5-methylcytosine-specific restriction enzyme A
MAKTRRANGFYDTPQWKALRRLALIRDGYRCTVCRCDVHGKGKARVDHIHSIHARPDLALVLSNLRVLCPSCDNQAHREKGGAPGVPRQGKPRDARFVIRGCDAQGRPLDPSHSWRQ